MHNTSAGLCTACNLIILHLSHVDGNEAIVHQSQAIEVLSPPKVTQPLTR